MRRMRSKLFRLVLTSSLGFATLATSIEVASAQPEVRDHRRGGGNDRRDDGPREAPPPMKTENRGAERRGYVWIDGSWDWKGGQWGWEAGHWERERRGTRWRQRKWEQRNGAWIRVDAGWDDDVATGPREAPPPLREEKFERRRGWTYVRGQWAWNNGKWDWQP